MSRKEHRYTVGDVINAIQNGESDVEVDVTMSQVSSASLLLGEKELFSGLSLQMKIIIIMLVASSWSHNHMQSQLVYT